MNSPAMEKLLDRQALLHNMSARLTFDLKKVMVEAFLAATENDTEIDYHKACSFTFDNKQYTFTVKLIETKDVE